MGIISSIFRNVLGKPGPSDFRDSAEHFVTVLRELGIQLTFAKDELRYADDLAERLAGHNEYRDALGSWLGEVLVRNFGGEWVPGHALGPAVRIKAPAANGSQAVRHVFPLGWVYRRADGGPSESIAVKLHRELGFPDPSHLGRFTDSGERA
ncbi:MAG TPA: hypothetical protein VGH20_12595 [Myxococcales bacterium]|jgi:hypothetical protein